MATITSQTLPEDPFVTVTVVFEQGNRAIVLAPVNLYRIFKTDNTHWRSFKTQSGFDSFIARKGLTLAHYEWDDGNPVEMLPEEELAQ